MTKLIEVQWDGKHGEPYLGDAIVEYTEVLEWGQDSDGSDMVIKCEREITNVFLPEYVPIEWQSGCKEQAEKQFYNTRRD